ncbi:PGSIP6 [Symbiodinium natans]|uniref:PGSIP6 protein n=1 Tax=Symbiodinium natans TaxID=878477 RepID=A0A812NTH3_9DINO|nr:PGSIP6 [Symbiodinium natans]
MDSNSENCLDGRLSASRDARRRALSEVARKTLPIPGYTGHLRAHKVENVFGATFGEAMVVAEAARHRRGREEDYMAHTSTRTHTFDGGSFNTTKGHKLGKNEPLAKTVSVYHNPRGHDIRAGAAVPGYGGFIPSKVAGNCFGKRMALDNLHATEMRRLNDEGAEWQTNWITACETNRKRLAHGAFSVNENFKFTRDDPKREVSASPSAWKVWEPKAPHQWIRY